LETQTKEQAGCCRNSICSKMNTKERQESLKNLLMRLIGTNYKFVHTAVKLCRLQDSLD